MEHCKIIAVGDNVCDKYLSRGKMYPGGQCVNTCVYVKMNNMESAYLGKYGDDEVAACVQDTLKEIGIEWVILGHSERRQYFGETDETVNAKMLQVLHNDMTPIVCVGETLEEYEAGTTKDVVKTQTVAAFKDVCPNCAGRVVIAYEPVWAIGTGKTATNEIAQDVCAYIRSVVAELYGQEVADKVRIQYGGSVKPEGLKELLEQPDIDGALVGGASLVEDSYKAMIAALD